MIIWELMFNQEAIVHHKLYWGQDTITRLIFGVWVALSLNFGQKTFYSIICIWQECWLVCKVYWVLGLSGCLRQVLKFLIISANRI
jgi:hypothetical protein